MIYGLTIRKATINDTEQLVELRKVLLSSGGTHYAAKSEEDDLAWQRAYREWIEENVSNKNVAILVGEYEGDCNICACGIGVIDLRAPMVGALNGKVGWIQSLVVHKDRRGLGIADAMMASLHQWFKDSDVDKVVVQSSKMAEEFYRKIGYTDTGEKLLVQVMQ
ncbi:Ribosomal protein S18 acetylase RimI [Marininema mesophilum]|uniref:Ribosomal protein S18 acetylase RimI n=1 Tax=Marininema mesophilum TaxID=1048340 RepID=A0A1H3ARJ7_9BACL|nr:GNAT family N-acetyltransferase [Marininema mesophilum]SDX32263.1 Ribosomal protein S18 acetylase RimI [Marininema mesophilum]